MKKIKVFIFLTIGILTIFLVPLNVFASEYDDIQNEVADLVDNGMLPKYHNYLSHKTGYQTFYMKMYKTSSELSTKDHFANMSYSEI